MVETIVRRLGRWEASITWNVAAPNEARWLQGIMADLCQRLPSYLEPAIPIGQVRPDWVFSFSATTDQQNPGIWQLEANDAGMLCVCGMLFRGMIGSPITCLGTGVPELSFLFLRLRAVE